MDDDDLLQVDEAEGEENQEDEVEEEGIDENALVLTDDSKNV